MKNSTKIKPKRKNIWMTLEAEKNLRFIKKNGNIVGDSEIIREGLRKLRSSVERKLKNTKDVPNQKEVV